MRSLVLSLLAALLVLAGCATTEAPTSTSAPAREASGDFAGLAEAIADERRGNDAARDAYRHPEETLRFFDVQPNHTVAEYAPGGGWYTKILAPYVSEQGRYVAVSFRGEQTGIERLVELLSGFEATYAKRVEQLSGVPADRITVYHTDSVPEEAQGTVDRILIPRMVHNLFRWNIANEELRGLRKLLKDDGLVGIVQHRAKPDSPWAYGDGSKGYLREADVIALMSINGFVLVGKSEINANPKDTADYEKGVWTLPPSFRLGDEDREKYAAIGESDRATLLFAKAK